MKPAISSTDRASPLRSVASVARRALPVLLILGVAIGGYLGYRAWAGDGAAVTYTTVAVNRGDVVQAVTSSGTLQPVVQSTVGAQVSGRIIELKVDFNDQVKKGDVLARIDRQIFEGQLAQARARLVSARASLAKAQAEAQNARTIDKRTSALLASGAVSQSDVETAQAGRRSADAAIETARASIVDAQAAVENAETNLTYTTITAPIDGVIVSRAVDVGQTVAASLQAPTLFVIAGDLAKMELHTSVAESDVGQIKEGMKVQLGFDAFPDKTFTGVVKQVRNQATTVSNVVTYDAVVGVDNPGGELRPGMTATATFVIAERRDVLVVPQKALRYRPKDAPAPDRARRRSGSGSGAATAQAAGAETRPADAEKRPAGGENRPAGGREWRGRGQAVWVLRAGKPVRVAVQTGLSDGTTVEISSGELKENDLVITADSQSATTPGAGSAASGGGNRGGGNRGRGGPPRLF